MADGKEYISRPDELGNIHISEEVLAVIAAAAALEVEGVGSLAANLGSDLAGLLGKKNYSKGSTSRSTRERVSVLMYPSSFNMVILSLMWPRQSRTRSTLRWKIPAA